MPRRQRIHVPGGTYYIVRRTHLPRPIFGQVDDYASIEGLLSPVLKRTGAELLAYCWMPDAMHFALQIDTAPVGDFMREVTSRYAQQVHLRTGERGQFFRRPYQATLIDADTYLPLVVKYLHFAPVLAGLVQHPDDYPHSSHRVYLGRACKPWLNTKPVLRLIDGFDEDRAAYRRQHDSPPPEAVGTLIERGQVSTPGILGDADFVARLPRRGRAFHSRWSLDEIAAHVARAHDIPRAHLVSKSRRQKLVLARAQMAWYATERRVASLSEVARYLRLSASSLTRAVSRHQLREPALFTLDAFAPLAPLAPLHSSGDLVTAEALRMGGEQVGTFLDN